MALNRVHFLLVSLFALSVLSDDNHNTLLTQFKTHIDECIDEIQVDKEIVEKSFKEGEFPDDKNLKCFFHCLHVKLNILNEDGVLNVEGMKNAILSVVNDKNKATLMENCSKIQKVDKCDTAFEMSKCFRTNLIG
ncbi:hypothetical protein FQR65_LT09970 [Abscondita terminalis]|nr:hypothetical protein FQR65_LT09970 [Abscondita terminalis]